MKYGIIIDKNNIKRAFVIVDDDGTIECETLLEGEKIIYDSWNIANSLLKPKWTGSTWVETAPQDEINEWNNKYKPMEKEPTTQEQINAQLLEEIAQQKIVNAQLMQEIATLKGVNANV